MENILVPATIATVVNLTITVGGLFYFKKYGGPAAANDIIELLKTRDDEQKKTIIEYQAKFDKINHELGVLRGESTEKDKKLAEYMKIFQGRNPELETFIKNTTDILGQQMRTSSETSKTLKDMHSLLKLVHADHKRKKEGDN